MSCLMWSLLLKILNYALSWSTFKCVLCYSLRAGSTYLGYDVKDATLVSDGTKCGEEKVTLL